MRRDLGFAGIGENNYPVPKEEILTGRWYDKCSYTWIVVDVRDLLDEWNPPIKYAKKIFDIEKYMDRFNVVVCCGAGQSRSAAVCLGYLLFKGKPFEQAWSMVHGKGSPANIDPSHISALKKLLDVDRTIIERFTKKSNEKDEKIIKDPLR